MFQFLQLSLKCVMCLYSSSEETRQNAKYISFNLTPFKIYCTRIIFVTKQSGCDSQNIRPCCCTAVRNHLVPFHLFSPVHYPGKEVDQLVPIHQVGVTSQVLISFAPCQVLLVLPHFLVACLQLGPACGSSLPRFSLLNTMCHFSHILPTHC